MYIGKIK